METLWRLSKRYSMVIEEYLREKIRGEPETLYEASLHIIKAGGKRLRPLLVLATARMLGGVEAEARALPLAAAVETLHNFTLIHDDIMDQDEVRRGVPTVHRVWGVPMAILAGDLLFAYAYRLAGEAADSGMDPATALRALREMTEAIVKISEGQAFDMMMEKKWDVSVSDYLKMIYLKTGSLIELCARLGALSAGASNEVVSLMGEYGRLIGVAFQIRDDFLGIVGDPKVTGKPVYNDLRRAKKTLPLIYAYSKLGEEERSRLRSLIGEKASDEELSKAAKMIENAGGISYALSLAREYSERALEIIKSLRAIDLEARSALEELAVYVVEREK